MSADAQRPAKTARLRIVAVPALLLALVLIGPGIYLDGTIGPDENIWAGMGLLWTAVWGLPWSLPLLFGALRVDSDNLEAAMFTVCALINVLLVTLLLAGRSRHAARSE